MKQKLKMIAMTCMAFALIAACSNDLTDAVQSISWYTLDDGIKSAKQSDKKIFLYFRADW